MKKIKCLKQGLSQILSASMVLISATTIFGEFCYYWVDHEIWYLRKHPFMGVYENEYPVIFCEKSKVHFEYMEKWIF